MGKNYDKRKAVLYVALIAILSLLIVAIFALSAYKSKSEADSQIAAIDFNKDVVASKNETIESSYSNDKTIKDVETQENRTDELNKIAIKTNDSTNNLTEETATQTIEKEEPNEPEEVALSFIVPLEGEITKGFSDSSLVYSETLKEWTTHPGIDIKADKGSAVIASESGTVESIKNDPRYGLTVTISHANGFKTIYSNLLSAEFVTEGQLVEKGQTIASVGSSGVFEIAETEHLHFEMVDNNGLNVNPANYFDK